MWNNKENIAKFREKCYNRGKWKYCYYWRAKKLNNGRVVLGYFCALFNQDKIGYNSLSQCNKKYGPTYDGKTYKETT